MLVYRVCNEVEASHQEVGKPWQSPPGKNPVWTLEKPGLYMSRYPEVWRRLNNACEQGIKSGTYWDHTLFLEVPDNCEGLEEQSYKGYAGMEYRLKEPSKAIVRGIAGPEWPLPDWCPQPPDKSQWDPYSRDTLNVFVVLWKPKGAYAPVSRFNWSWLVSSKK